MESLLADIEKVIYSDSDILVLCDLSIIWDTPMGGFAVLACLDYKISNLGSDPPIFLSHEERSLPYFNSGVLVADLETWRKLGIQDQAIELMNNPESNCRWHDQTILNYLLRGKIKVLPDKWNWRFRNDPVTLLKSACLYHYKGTDKPWSYWSYSFRFKAWRECYKICIGLPLLFFLQNNYWRGLFNGVFNGLVENSPFVRECYLRYLRLSLRLSRQQDRRAGFQQKIFFLESPRKPRDRSLENRLLKAFRQRLIARTKHRQT